jgi:hypothetical protein
MRFYGIPVDVNQATDREGRSKRGGGLSIVCWLVCARTLIDMSDVVGGDYIYIARFRVARMEMTTCTTEKILSYFRAKPQLGADGYH